MLVLPVKKLETVLTNISDILKNDLSTFLVKHFNNDDHDINDLKVSIIDYITSPAFEQELLELENYFIRTLNCMYPFGLNDNIKGFGNVLVSTPDLALYMALYM